MTVSSKRHAQVERAKEEKRENAASMRGAGRDPGPEDGAHGGALAREAEKRDDFSYFLVITSKLRLDLLTCVDVYYEHKKQKARPKGVNLKVRSRAKFAVRYR